MSNDYDLIITSNKIKNDLLNKNSNLHLLVKYKVLTLDEFMDKYYGSLDNNAYLYLMRKYHYNYELCDNIINNIYYLKDYYEELLNNNLIKKDLFFKNSFKKVLIYNLPMINKCLIKELSKYDLKIENSRLNNYEHIINEFKNNEDEVNNLCLRIRELLDQNIDVNKIKIVINESSKLLIKRYFNYYNLPINIDLHKSIYQSKNVVIFLKELKDNHKICLDNLEDNDVKNKIIDILNKYDLNIIDDSLIQLIDHELLNSYLDLDYLEDSIEIIKIDDLNNNDNYYFITSFNEGINPLVYEDNDYLSDNDKEKLGMLTSKEKNMISKEGMMNKYYSYKNIYISYYLEDNERTYMPSLLIDEYNLKVNKEDHHQYYYSNIYNKITLSKALDNLIKYNHISKDLELYNYYSDFKYLSFNHKYTKIDIDKYHDYLNNKIVLSYTSVNDYFNCRFKYYLKKVLNIEVKEDSLSLKIGNLYHYILSKIYDKDFDFDKLYDYYLSNLNMSKKEEFFLNNLKDELKKIINRIKIMDESSSLKSAYTEEKISLNKGKITIFGIVDKIKYLKDDKELIMMIVDYKTGSIETKIDNLNYGLNMQLPMYLYLVSNHYDNVIVGGFYLQKILNNKEVDNDQEDLLLLDGFTNSNIDIISKIDHNYENSKVIKGMKLNKEGLSNYAKVLSSDEIAKLNKIVDDLLKEAGDNIFNGEFDINPKRINNKLLGCEYCEFNDICFKDETDIIDLENKKISSILGGSNV